MRYTNAATIVSEDFRDTEDLDGLFSGWDPETRTYDPESWQYEDMEVAAASGQRELGAPTGQAAHGAHGGALEQGEPPHHDETLQHPRCVYQLLRRHFARYTPELVEETCGVSREQIPRGVRGAVRELRAASARAPSATPSAGPSTRSACSTSAPPRSSSCCWATSAARAAASWPCAATRRSRARPTSRRSTTSCPATCRCPRAEAHGSLRGLHRAELAAGRLLGQHGRLHRLAAEGVVGRRGHGRERLLLRPPAAPDRRPLLLHVAGGHGRRDGQGPVRHGREPDRGRRQRRATTAPPCAASTGSWCATWSRSRRPPSGTTRPRSRPARSRTADIATEVFFLPGGDPRREEGHLHQHPAPAAVARAGRRAARRLPLGAVVHVPPRPPRAREAGRLERRARPGRARADLGLPDRGRLRRSRRRGRPARDRRRRPDDGQGGARLPAARRTTARRRAGAGSTPAATPAGSTRSRGASPARSSRGWRPSGAGRGR